VNAHEPCEFPGCTHTPATGWPLFRTSPKGGPFKGRCSDHMGEPVDPVVADIVEAIAADRRSAR
jgi:hypothetical protein